MRIKYLMMGMLLAAGSSAAQANGMPGNNPGQEKMSEAQTLAAQKRAKAEEARSRHEARIAEERAAGKPQVTLRRRYSLQ